MQKQVGSLFIVDSVVGDCVLVDLLADMYENAHKKQPDSEEILNSLFMAYVRLGQCQKQQQVSYDMICKKVAHTRLPSVGFRSWYWFLAVSLQVMWAINPVLGCPYFFSRPTVTPAALRRLLPVFAVWWTGTMGVNSMPKTVTRHRHECYLNRGPSAPGSSTLTTQLPRHVYICLCLLLLQPAYQRRQDQSNSQRRHSVPHTRSEWKL